MTPDAAHLTALYRRNLKTVLGSTDRVSDTAAHVRPGGANSLNWVAGHVLSTRLVVLRFLEAELPGIDGAALRALYGKDTHPDAARALPLAELRAGLEASQTALEQALNSADLSVVRDFPMGQQPLGDLVDFFGWHEAYHAGQLALLWRMAQS